MLALAEHPMGIDALIRSMGVNQPCRHMLFLGAGASITSGIKSGWSCIWEWKLEIFLSAQPHISPALLGDPSLSHVQERIQAWLDATGGFPQAGSDGEYEFYAERCYPAPRDRRKYFENLISGASPSLGYQLLGLLIETGHFRWIWSTNFDDLVDRGRSGDRRRTVRQVGMDSRSRILAAEPDDRALHHMLLHGDYRYDHLRNTAAETRSLDEEFRRELVRQCATYSLVVVGYSGRDRSVMDALTEAYSQPGEGGLYWLNIRDSLAQPTSAAPRRNRKAPWSSRRVRRVRRFRRLHAGSKSLCSSRSSAVATGGRARRQPAPSTSGLQLERTARLRYRHKEQFVGGHRP